MSNKIVSTIESHPIITSIILGTAGLGIAIIFARRASSASASSNTSPQVFTDASGNPIDPYTGQPLPGASVSPQMSNSDVASLLQDMEQQILNWEQSISSQLQNGSSGGSSSGGSSGGSVGGNHGCLPGQTWNPVTKTCGDANPGNPGPTLGGGNPPTPGQHGNNSAVYATTGVWGQSGNPFTSIWAAWQQWGQPKGENFGTYENQFVQWNRISNPNIIQAHTSYRVW